MLAHFKRWNSLWEKPTSNNLPVEVLFGLRHLFLQKLFEVLGPSGVLKLVLSWIKYLKARKEIWSNNSSYQAKPCFSQGKQALDRLWLVHKNEGGHCITPFLPHPPAQMRSVLSIESRHAVHNSFVIYIYLSIIF